MPLTRRRLLKHLGRGAIVAGVGVAGAALLTERTPRGAALAQSNPAQTGQWQGPFATPLTAIHAIVLPHAPSGRVLLMHGDHRGRGSLIYLWNSATMTFIQKQAPVNVFCGGHASLADGTILVAGGHVNVHVGLTDCFLFDPLAESWTRTASMAFPRWYPTCTTLPDGRILAVAGGEDSAGATAIPEIYARNGASAGWTQLSQPSAIRRLGADPYYPFMTILPSGNVFHAGPDHIESAGRVDPPNAIFNWRTSTWQDLFPGPVLNLGEENAPLVTFTNLDPAAGPLKQRMLVCGGRQSPSAYWAQANAWMIDFEVTVPDGGQDATAGWYSIAPMRHARVNHNATVLPDGTVLVTGGGGYSNNKNAAVLVAESFNPANPGAGWTALTAMKKGRFHHSTNFLLPDGRVVVTGTDLDKSLEIFSPPYLFKGARPVLANVPAATGYNAVFAATSTTAISEVSLIRPAATTHAYDENQRYVRLPFTQTTTPSGVQLSVTTPANSNLAPPGVYMLFALNAAGAPSVAAWLRLG